MKSADEIREHQRAMCVGSVLDLDEKTKKLQQAYSKYNHKQRKYKDGGSGRGDDSGLYSDEEEEREEPCDPPPPKERKPPKEKKPKSVPEGNNEKRRSSKRSQGGGAGGEEGAMGMWEFGDIMYDEGEEGDEAGVAEDKNNFDLIIPGLEFSLPPQAATGSNKGRPKQQQQINLLDSDTPFQFPSNGSHMENHNNNNGGGGGAGGGGGGGANADLASHMAANAWFNAGLNAGLNVQPPASTSAPAATDPAAAYWHSWMAQQGISGMGSTSIAPTDPNAAMAAYAQASYSMDPQTYAAYAAAYGMQGYGSMSGYDSSVMQQYYQQAASAWMSNYQASVVAQSGVGTSGQQDGPVNGTALDANMAIAMQQQQAVATYYAQVR
jgi:hypothetical protein